MWLDLIQLVLAIVLTTIIVIQAKGAGLGSTFGGQSQSYHSKRGVEKAIFSTTIVVATLFTLVSLLNFWL
ncbi:MAG TPA: preprotein translocase subunit SecG [Patescibacteria group bacterium]|nr:preprotein translocase subunit SecG [Patescibacteria group bacterium]